MPGPCNMKRKKKSQSRKERKSTSARNSLDNESLPESNSGPSSASVVEGESHQIKDAHAAEEEDFGGGIRPQTPFIHDPGNGPRVRNIRAFLSSSFAQPPTLDQPLCAEFAQKEVLQMLQTVLPEETAMILWYNKSRATGRICPACRRLYQLGDNLPDLMDDEVKRTQEQRSPYLLREQQISGLCSPVCFILASFNYPSAIKTTWGRLAPEIDDYTWELLNGPGEGQGDSGLSLLLKMTRLDDLGLGQLCLPDVDFDSELDVSC